MQTCFHRYRQRDHSRTAHRSDDTRSTTNRTLSCDPTALPQAS